MTSICVQKYLPHSLPGLNIFFVFMLPNIKRGNTVNQAGRSISIMILVAYQLATATLKINYV